MTAVSSAYAQRFLMTLFLVSFGIYLFLATITYTPFDPGWMQVSSDTQQVANASGVAGAWIADLLFGFLGWASVLLPIYLFLEAIQVWWPYSFLNRTFRYAAQFFLVLVTASLLYLTWQIPADTLENASGGIIGFELGNNLKALLTDYGAMALLAVLWAILFTLAFGVKWNKTWDLIKATPAYLQDLFYKNVPESEADFDLTTASSHKKNQKTAHDQQQGHPQTAVNSSAEILVGLPKTDEHTERLFNDMIQREQQAQQAEQILATAALPEIDDEVLEKTIEKGQQLRQDPAIVAQKGENWTAVMPEKTDRQAQHEQQLAQQQEINELLRATEQELALISAKADASSEALDWNDDQAFQTLMDQVQSEAENPPHVRPVLVPTEPASATPSNISLEEELEALIQQDQAEKVQRSIYAQSSTFVHAPIQQVQVQPALNSALSKTDFIEAWQETAGKPIDEDDWDAPLTDVTGRPMSRAMQQAEHRRGLSTLPGLELLDSVDPNKKVSFSTEQLSRLSELLEIKLQEFNVKAKVMDAQPGPVVTRFELDLAPGVKASKVTNISRDLARSMSMASVRVVEVIPGKPYIGIEVPNSSREMVRLIELVQTPAFTDPTGLLSMAMGKDISGRAVIADLGKAPHMLVAGTTGSGKSVAVNSMILSMLLKYTPDQLRLILIDPKQLELANYNDIPHLLTPVVTDMKDAVNALNWCVNEMERRYKLMSFLKIRKLADYNRKIEEAMANGEELIDPTWLASDSATQERAPRLQPLPAIVIVADEFADMIMQVGKKSEEMITRLAQKSRAAGIHLLLATQRPSVDVITGLIKANIPTRAALRVNSKIDSRTILDAGGAEDLLGHGDMLFLGPGKIEPERVHGAFISDDEVNRICDAWRERGAPNYVDEILTPFDEEPTSRGFDDADGAGSSERDILYDQCVSFVLETRKSSASALQRKFSLGYNRAARIIDQMEQYGVLSELGANGKRDILV